MATSRQKKSSPPKTPQKVAAKSKSLKKTVKEPNHVRQIVDQLAVDYADAECALLHDSPFQLLIATILSAQCTDERVNIVTRELFAKYPDAHALAAAELKDVEKIVQSTGFFRAKAKNIVGCSQQLVEKYNGEVPQELAKLVVLPGVGRKTANVVLGTAFGIPTGVVVDTHVGRISKRLGFTQHTDAVKIEQDLMRILPQADWIMFAHRLIHHGRRVCKARKPVCSVCNLAEWCPRIGVETSS